MVTVEKVSRILEKFGISFTERSVERYLVQGHLDKERKPYEVYSKYNFLITEESLKAFLSSRGVSQAEIDAIL